MAKTKDEEVVPTQEQPTQEQPTQEQPTQEAPPTYSFRANGSERVYEVDAAHLETMRSRSDLTYVGNEPLPPKR